MRRMRREPPEARIELNPLIDLMTFLLTFFIYAVVMMVRVDMVPMELKQFASGKPAIVDVMIDQHTLAPVVYKA